MKHTFYLIIILLVISVNTSFSQSRAFEINGQPPYVACDSSSFMFDVDSIPSHSFRWEIYDEEWPPNDHWRYIGDLDTTNYSGFDKHELIIDPCITSMDKGSYRCVRTQNSNGNQRETEPVTLIVIDTLSKPEGTSVNPNSICPLSLPATITLKTNDVNQYGKAVWYHDKEGEPIDEGTTIEYELESPDDTTFYVRWELPGGCYSTWDSVSLIIENPIITSLSYLVDAIPAKDTIIDPVHNPDIIGKTFWVEPIGLDIDEETGQITLSNETKLGNYTVYFTIENECADTSKHTISVYEGISAAFTYDNDEYCKSIDEDPLPNITGDEEGKFSSDNPDIKINPNTGLIKLSKTKPGEYDITYTIVSISSTVNITIKDLPAAPDSISSSVKSYCYSAKPDAITFTLEGGGDENITVKWYKDSLDNEFLLGGPTLKITGDSIPDSTTKVFARWTNDCGDSQADSVTIHVSHNPDVKEIEVVDGNIFCRSGIHGQEITFKVLQHNPNDSIFVYMADTLGEPIIRGTEESYAVIGDQNFNDTTVFYAKWKNDCGETDFTEVAIYLDDILFNKNLEKPIDSICNLSSWDIEIQAQNLLNSELKYRWYKNDKKIPGQNKAMLSLDVVTADDNGIYYCMVERRTKPICSIFSDSTELKVVELENRILTKGINEEYETRDSVPVLLVGSNPGLSYQWYFKGVDDYDYAVIDSANQQYYYPSNYTFFNDGKFASGTYMIEASDTTGLRCVVTDEHEIILPVTQKASIVIYPNPNRGNSTINIPGNPSLEFHDEGTLRIWNLMGALEREVPLIRQAEPSSISIRNLSSGMYMVEVQFKNGDHYTDKIIVQ